MFQRNIEYQKYVSRNTIILTCCGVSADSSSLLAASNLPASHQCDAMTIVAISGHSKMWSPTVRWIRTSQKSPFFECHSVNCALRNFSASSKSPRDSKSCERMDMDTASCEKDGAGHEKDKCKHWQNTDVQRQRQKRDTF